MVSRRESKTQRKLTLGTRITSTASASTADRLDGGLLAQTCPGLRAQRETFSSLESQVNTPYYLLPHCGETLSGKRRNILVVVSSFGFLAAPIFHFLQYLSSSEKRISDRCIIASSSPLTVKI